MKNKEMIKVKEINFDDEIKLKDIDKGEDSISFIKKNKSVILFSAAAILILIMAILIISNIAGYTE
ncbi:hypothetical protein SAMN04487886_103713 [Clostridium sp. DSM 8431]|uniref:hypothetical protein n=1 Tax=Clostridium sp. DSM 8431 TaxID=1761781 RepID=UPI0008E0D97A|nr:hypothetical protein [Clostridium sp. DSM 8431]SFU48103.1 hypothetical protein SAMN04487886_103713 [Clostridium sp. DSM 8431]